MKKMLFGVCALVAAAGASYAATYSADTLAIYPFTDKEVGEEIGKTAGAVVNAADPEHFSGKGDLGTAYTPDSDANDLTTPRISDDLPGVYVMDGSNATEPLWGPGDYHSLCFGDYTTRKSGGQDWPLVTNATDRTVNLTYRSSDGALRACGSASLILAGFDSALAKENAWTIEFFYRHLGGLTYNSGQQLIHAPTYAGVQFYSCYGRWNQQGLVTKTEGGTNTKRIELLTNVNLSEGAWYHVAIVHSGTTTTYYLNHEQTYSVDNHVQSDPEGAVADMWVGDWRTYPGSPFYGTLAALRVTKKALTKDEMLYVRDTRPGKSLTITDDYVVPAEGETCENLTIDATGKDGALTVSGGKLTVQGNVCVTGGSVALAGELDLIGVKPTFTVDEGAELHVNASIGGDADFTLWTDGTTTFSAANTFTGELSIKGKGAFHAAHDLAFGSADKKTTFYSQAASGELKFYFDGIDTAEPFESYLIANGTSRVIFAADSETVLRGLFANKGGYLCCQFNAGTHAVFSNDVLGVGYMSSSGIKTSVVDIWGTVESYRYPFNAGTYRFHHRVRDGMSADYGINPASSDCVYVMCATNVFAASDDATQAYAGAVLRFSSASTFDLNGYDQRINTMTGGGKATVKSDTPAVLHIDTYGTAPKEGNTFAGGFGGVLTVSVEGPLPITFDGKSTTTGPLIVNAGSSVTLGTSAIWGGSDVRVTGADARLKIVSPAALGREAVLTVADGGAVELAYDAQMAIGKIVVGSEELTEGGTYGAKGSGADHELDCLTGTGRFVLAAREAKTGTWNPPDAAADSKMSSPANWSGDVPEFASGLDRAIFSTVGESTVVDVDASFTGVTLTRPAGGTFTFDDGGGSLTLGVEGLVVANGSSDSRSFTNNVATALAMSQTWDLPGTGTTLVVNAPISASDGVTLRVTGNGNLHLTRPNPDFLGQLVFDTTPAAKGCVVHVWDDLSLGAGALPVKMNAQSVAVTSEQVLRLYFHGDRTIANDIECNESDAPTFTVEADSRVEFTGAVKFGTIVRPAMGSGSEVVFSGSFDTGCYRVAPPTGGKVVVSNSAPQRVGSFNGMIYSEAASQTGALEVHSPSNVWHGTYGIEYAGNIDVHLRAPEALHYDAKLGKDRPHVRTGNYMDRWTYIDLHGFDQSCADLQELVNSSSAWKDPASHASFHSETPAQLHVHQNVAQTVTHLAFEGAAGLTMEPADAALTLENIPSTTTGKLEIAGGTLNLSAAWPNASEVVVSAGALNLQTEKLFGRRTTALKLSGGTLDLGGTEQRVYEIWVDGKMLPSGEYTAASEELKGYVTGAGTLRACGHAGSVMLVR